MCAFVMLMKIQCSQAYKATQSHMGEKDTECVQTHGNL